MQYRGPLILRQQAVRRVFHRCGYCAFEVRAVVGCRTLYGKVGAPGARVAPLAGYAKFRIRGEMLDTVRRNSGPGRELRRTVSSISPRMRNLAYPASGAPLCGRN